MDRNLVPYSTVKRFVTINFVCLFRYERQLERFCDFVDILLDSPTPEISRKYDASFTNRVKDTIHKSVFWGRCFRNAVGLGQKDLV